ncbi:MAG: cache domain-containing protein [Prolixibacteraceae bacterium]|nr:cache domain-containing protein [Prolixibacteraceae bacterium]
MPRSFFRRIAIPSNISTYLSRTLIIITVATTFLIGGVLVISQTLHFKKISQQKSQEYINDQKVYIQEIVKNEFEYIRIQNEIFRQNINAKIRQNVNQALLTAESIYNQYAQKKSEEEIKVLIIATISSLKFEMEYEEVFISTLDGTGIYYPRKPEFTGRDMNQFKDANGTSVVLEEIRLLKTKDEGFLDYNINSKLAPTTSPHKKITFVKKFGHFNWYFGSKQYVDDYFPKFSEEIAQKVSSVRFKHGGYIFVNHTNGTPIVMDGKVYKGNLNLLEQTNDKRHSVFLQELEVATKNPDGGYFNYKWNKINDTIPSEKCAYVQLFKDFNWLIGAGFYLDEIHENISQQQRSLRKDQQKSIFIIFLILVILLFCEALIIYHFNKRYKSDFDGFFNFFYLSQNSFNKLNVSKFYFDEFKRAGVAANKMILLREEIESRLIEEQKKATESDRLKSAFLANMSHEIRTPMNAIIGFSELLEDDGQDDEDRIVFVKLIRKNGDVLLNLINDIIDISKIEANLLTVRRKPVKLDKFLDEIKNYYIEILASKKDKAIEFKLNNEVNPEIAILTDEMRLKQILDNLIGNAIKFTTSGTISVDVKMDGELVHFSVSDTGIGIPHNQQANIFERFIQAEQGHKMNLGGTGLGLAISKNLIELLGGTIHVKSEPSKGSTFDFYIQAN